MMSPILQNRVYGFSCGNPGAINVMRLVVQAYGEAVANAFLDDLSRGGFSGAGIWVLYKDCAGEDIDTMLDGLRDPIKSVEWAMIVNRECGS